MRALARRAFEVLAAQWSVRHMRHMDGSACNELSDTSATPTLASSRKAVLTQETHT